MQPNITKSALYNFHIIGLFLSVKFILTTLKYEVSQLFAIFISVYIIFFLYRMAINFRDTEFKGRMNYGQAFKYIFLIYLFGSVISSIVMLIYTSFIDKHFLDLLLDSTLKMYEQFKFPLDNKTISLYEHTYKPIQYSLLNIFLSSIVGTFWSLILAGFVKKEKSIFEE